MPIYFARAGADGPVKIGMAASPAGRVRDLQYGLHEELSLVRETPGGRTEERALHWWFREHRIRGEWFNFVPEMMKIDPAEAAHKLRAVYPPKEIKPPVKPEPPACIRKPDVLVMETTFASWLSKNGCSVNAFAKASGLHHRGLYRLAGIRGFAGDRGGVHFTEPFLDRVAEITGIAPATLVSDAWAARESPRAPRKYVRKAAG